LTFHGTALQEVRTPVMIHRWSQLTFVHWQYDVDEVQRLLPAGLTVQPFNGTAWVGLVPFVLGVRLPGLAAVPWMSRFPETNVRTYVTDRHGKAGIWFFSLDADRLAAVVTARATYRLPYFWSTMKVEQAGTTLTYTSKRRWPAPAGAETRIGIEIGDRIPSADLTELDHFLTARWTLFSQHRHGLSYADAHHVPWPLQRATVTELTDGLVAASGLSAPTGEPLVHYSPDVEVRLGLPHRVR